MRPRGRTVIRALVAKIVRRRRRNVEAVQGQRPVLTVGIIMGQAETIPRGGAPLVLHLIGATGHVIASRVAAVLGQVQRLLIRRPHALPRAVQEQSTLLRLMDTHALLLAALPAPAAEAVRRHALLGGQAELGFLTGQAQALTHLPAVPKRRLLPIAKVGIRPVKVLTPRPARPAALVPAPAKRRQLRPEAATSPTRILTPDVTVAKEAVADVAVTTAAIALPTLV